MKEVFWVLPALFVFHDFEEIICMEQWIKNLDRQRVYMRLPKRTADKLLLYFDGITTANFAKSVYILYTVLINCTLISYVWNYKEFWISLFLVFTIHLFIHCIQAIILRSYIPALYTSVLCIPICVWLLNFILGQSTYSLTLIILQTSLIAAILIILLFYLHKFM